MSFLPCAAFGSKFKDLVDAVDHFWACVDPSDADTRYVWLDIFAIPQNDPGSVLGDGSLLESVIHHSSCQLTLCVLDRALLPLSRLWCLTELSMSSTRQQAVATTTTSSSLPRSSAFLLHDGGVVFSTYGSTLSDQLDMLAECRIDAAAAVCSDPADTVRLRAALLAQFGDLSHVTAHLKALLAEGLSRQQRAARAALAATGCSEWAVSVGTQTSSDMCPSIANQQQPPVVAPEHAALMKVASDSLAKLAVPALRNRLRKAALPAAGPRPALVARLLKLEQRTAAEQDAATASCPDVVEAVMVQHDGDEEWCTPEDEDDDDDAMVIATHHDNTPAQQLLPLVGGGGGGGIIVIRRGTSTGYRPEFVAVLEERW